MDNKKIKVGVVIPSINLWAKFTKPCIDSVKTKYDYRIVLVDNGSTDETREEAGKLVSATFTHKRNEQNVGCQGAWNYGIKDSFEHGCDYVLVCNNDILLHKDAIDKLVDRFESSKTSDEHLTLAMVTAMDIRGELPIPTMIDALNTDFKANCAEAESPNYSAYMISKLYWDKIGEFDLGFFPAYFEDNDSHYRMKLAGLKAIVYPPAMFYHFGSRTQNEAGPGPLVSGSLFEANRNYFIDKWGGAPSQEKYQNPFNDEKKHLSWTLQIAHTAECSCVSSCATLLTKYKKCAF